MAEAANPATVQQEQPSPRVPDRRAYDRYSLGNAKGTLTYKGVKSSCLVIDISLDGCLIRTERRFPHGALAYVEVDLHLFGMILHIGGVTQWTRQQRVMGVRFVHPTPRAKNELAGLLTCLVDRDAAGEIQEALSAAKFDPLTTRILASEAAVAAKKAAKLAAKTTGIKEPSAAPAPAPAPQAPQPKMPPVQAEKPRVEATPAPRIQPPPEARPQSKPQSKPIVAPALEPLIGSMQKPQEEEFDWSAELYFLKDNAFLHGTVVDIRMEGCGFQTHEPYQGKHPAQVEVEFKMRGLPFRLAGRTEPTRDPLILGIRFLVLSARSRDQLMLLLQEIREAEARDLAAAEDGL